MLSSENRGGALGDKIKGTGKREVIENILDHDVRSPR